MIRLYKLIIPFALLITLVISCQKDYFEDTGLHNPHFEGTTLDYLNTRPDLFDTLVYILQLADLENEITRENVTFFAPPDQSIRKAVFDLNALLHLQGKDTVKQYDQIDPSIWRKYLSDYIYTDKYLLKDFPQLDTTNLQAYPGQGYVALSGKAMNIGVLYNDVVSKNSNGDTQIIKYAGYRQLYLNYVTNFGMIAGPVATSDIQTKNGALHVLNMTKHAFGFGFDFIVEVNLKGIKPLD